MEKLKIRHIDHPLVTFWVNFPSLLPGLGSSNMSIAQSDVGKGGRNLHYWSKCCLRFVFHYHMGGNLITTGNPREVRQSLLSSSLLCLLSSGNEGTMVDGQLSSDCISVSTI